MNTLDVLLHIVQDSSDIDGFYFHKFPKQQLVQNSNINWGLSEQKMLDKALDLKKKGLPFWDGIMLGTFDNPNFSEELLEAALHHNTHPLMTYVPKEELFSWSEKQINEIDNCAFCSKVLTNNKEERHLPLLDFHIPVSEINVRVVESTCKKLGLHVGWILNSGESYHYIGEKPIAYNDLELLLYNAIMFTPIVDKAWISHQLREHSCSLRIGQKNGRMPEVVKEL